MTCTCGSASSGNASIGRCQKAIAPATANSAVSAKTATGWLSENPRTRRTVRRPEQKGCQEISPAGRAFLGGWPCHGASALGRRVPFTSSASHTWRLELSRVGLETRNPASTSDADPGGGSATPHPRRTERAMAGQDAAPRGDPPEDPGGGTRGGDGGPG